MAPCLALLKFMSHCGRLPFLSLFFLVGAGFELRDSCLQSRFSTTWATSPVLLFSLWMHNILKVGCITVNLSSIHGNSLSFNFCCDNNVYLHISLCICSPTSTGKKILEVSKNMHLKFCPHERPHQLTLFSETHGDTLLFTNANTVLHQIEGNLPVG
jgi:hypothetical protein